MDKWIKNLTKIGKFFLPGVPLPKLPVVESKSQDGIGDMPQSAENIGSGTDKIPMSVPKTEEEPKRSFLDILCPYCAGKNFVKRGLRRKNKETVQLYLCHDCRRTFTPGSVKGKHYPLNVILDAMSLYYLGYSLEESAKIANRINKENSQIDQSCHSRAGGNPGTATEKISAAGTAAKTSDNVGSGMLSASTLNNWIEKYKDLCAFARMRPFAMKMFSPQNMIASATLAHRQLYRFRHHRGKTELIIREDFKHYRFRPLQEFLNLVPVECPHQYFQEGLRASEAPIAFSKTEMIVRGKVNYACKLTKFVLQSVGAAKDRHDALQRFLLANDSVTVATEVPVYIRREDLAHMQTQLGFKLYHKNKKNCHPELVEGSNAKIKKADANPPADGQHDKKSTEAELKEMALEELPKLITGHIDFLQIRNGAIHIMDYKPNAAKVRPIEQLTLYALALSRLTGLRLFHFKCAWFDEKDYFEFFPLHVVYKPDKKRRRRKIGTIEGTYTLNDNAKRMDNIRPASDVA